MRGAFLVAMAGTLASCGWISRTYRYEMVIETRSSRGVETWTGVREVIRDMSERGHSYDWRGEAIPIDLGDGHFAYALPIGSDRRENYSSAIYLATFGSNAPALRGLFGATEVWPEPPTKGEIFSFAPMIVRFTNDGDPQTLQVVSYDKNRPQIAPGIIVTRIAIRRTTKPLHFSLDQRLPWLHGQTQPLKLGSPSVALPELPGGLYFPDFIRGARPATNVSH